MRSFFKRSTSKPNTRPSRSRKRGMDYGTLEERRVLATTAAFVPLSGVLTVTLSDVNDAAVVDVVNDVVTINGSDQFLGGTTTLSANDVQQITVNGAVGISDQTLVLTGNFTDAAGRDLDNVFIQNVNQVSVLGAYDVNQNFTANLDGSGGAIGDGPIDGLGRLIVDGTTTINAGNNVVQLDNAANDFSIFSATTTGSIDNDIEVSDANSILLGNITSSGDLVVDAVGTINDTTTANIAVARDGRFSGTDITLGSDSQTTNFLRVAFDASGTASLEEDSTTIIVSSDVQSLSLSSPGGIFDGTATTVTVAGLAQIDAGFGIRFGDNGPDTFNAGSVTFNSFGHVSISERSGTNLFGDNTAGSWTSRSIGNITNSPNATLNVTNQTGLAAANVSLGDEAGDNIQTGALFFFATDDFTFEADSDLVIIERKNESGTLDLRSTGTITDDDIAVTNIRGLAQFTAESVEIGDTLTDEFNAGSIQFDTETTFQLNENSSLNIVNDSTAGPGSSIINSTGDITNAVGATVDIEGAAGFFGDNITLGNQTGDNFQFGFLTFNTATDATGLVDIAEDDSTLIVGINTANNLNLESLGAILDGQTASTTVAGNSSFTAVNGNQITIGDQGDILSGGVDTGNDFNSIFNSGSLTVNSAGDVFVEEESTIFLTGTSFANNLTLSAGLGQFDIIDTFAASITATGTLDVTGDLINLGTGVAAGTTTPSDQLSIGGLTFNSTGNTIISSQSGFELQGDSLAGGILILESEGQITADIDATFASIGGSSVEDVDGIIDFVIA